MIFGCKMQHYKPLWVEKTGSKSEAISIFALYSKNLPATYLRLHQKKNLRMFYEEEKLKKLVLKNQP